MAPFGRQGLWAFRWLTRPRTSRDREPRKRAREEVRGVARTPASPAPRRTHNIKRRNRSPEARPTCGPGTLDAEGRAGRALGSSGRELPKSADSPLLLGPSADAALLPYAHARPGGAGQGRVSNICPSPTRPTLTPRAPAGPRVASSAEATDAAVALALLRLRRRPACQRAAVRVQSASLASARSQRRYGDLTGSLGEGAAGARAQTVRRTPRATSVASPNFNPHPPHRRGPHPRRGLSKRGQKRGEPARREGDRLPGGKHRRSKHHESPRPPPLNPQGSGAPSRTPRGPVSDPLGRECQPPSTGRITGPRSRMGPLVLSEDHSGWRP